MVRLTRIYTRGGDAGETSLGDGARVPKYDPRVAAFGTVDEANAAIGVARLHTSGEAAEERGQDRGDRQSDQVGEKGDHECHGART